MFHGYVKSEQRVNASYDEPNFGAWGFLWYHDASLAIALYGAF